MIQSLLETEGGPVRFEHVPMTFSSEIGDVGQFRVGKLVELVRVIAAVWRVRAKGATAIYYPPSGPNLIPILRDTALLLATRWLFSTVIYHFHAGGLGEKLESLPAPLRWIARAAYGRPDLAIRASNLAPEDGRALGARRDVVIPYGIDAPEIEPPSRTTDTVRILSVGAVRRSKGTDALLEAVAMLRERGLDVEVEVVGAFGRNDDENRLTSRAAQPDLEGVVTFSGVLRGLPKWEAYARADIFAFPTFYESETFGIVLLEAMASRLPIVATRWRGVPTVVSPDCATIVEPRDPVQLADALEALARDPDLRTTMGCAGRKRFDRHFSSDRFRLQMQQAMADVIAHGEGEEPVTAVRAVPARS